MSKLASPRLLDTRIRGSYLRRIKPTLKALVGEMIIEVLVLVLPTLQSLFLEELHVTRQK